MSDQICLFNVEDLHPAEDNLRREMRNIDELAESMKGVGLLQPFVVRANNGGFEVIAGGRRLEAVKKAGIKQVVGVLREFDDQQRVEAMLVENLQRDGLAPLEEAEGYRRLLEFGVSQRELGERLGVSQSHISKRVALLALPEQGQKALDSGGITIEDALELTKLSEHPERIPKAIEYAKQRSWATMGQAVHEQLNEQKRADEKAVAKARAKSEGIKLVGYPSQYGTKARVLGKAGEFRQIGLTKAQHKSEPCHAAALEPHHMGPDKFVYVCTDATRHNKKGESKLKLDKDIRVESTSQTNGGASKADREKEEAERKTLEALDEKRREWLTELVATMRGKKISKDELATVIASALVNNAGGTLEAEADADKALGIKGNGYRELQVARAKYASESPASLQRLAFARAVFGADFELTETYGRRDFVSLEWYAAFVTRHGYEFSALERSKYGIKTPA